LVRFADLGRACLLASLLGMATRVAGASVPETLRACARERDDTARLACYDREIRHLEELESKSFGLTGQQKDRLDPSPRQSKATAPVLSGVVAELKAQPDGRTMITLEDGAVWIEGEAYEPIELRVGDRVSVRSGFLGSFYMYPSSGPPVRVRRLR